MNSAGQESNACFRQQLLAALDRPEIREKLRQICAAEPAAPETEPGREPGISRGLPEAQAAWAAQRERLEREIAGLRDRLEEQRHAARRLEELERESAALREALVRSKETLARAEEGYRELERERTGLEQALRAAESNAQARERALREAERIAGDLERDFQPCRELCELWRRFGALSGEAGDEAGKFLPREDPMRFFAVGCQRETLFRLWDVLCRQCQRENGPGEETLLEILAFFLKCYNYNYSAPVLELMTGETGQAYDKERHLRSPACSMYQGQIRQVLLPGIWNRNKGCAERKCLVYF